MDKLQRAVRTKSLFQANDINSPVAGIRRRVRSLFRALKIIRTLASFALYVYLDFRGWLGNSEEKREARLRRHAIRLRERLIKLGPTFIKIGQALGTRADLLPIQYVDELAALQDEVPAFPKEEAFSIIESELGCRPEELFAWISDKPVAAASLGQVYRARLKSGPEVAVKVQRPRLNETIAFDLQVLRRIARFLERYPNLLRGNDWVGMLDEFDRVVHEEMDYLAEGNNAERFRENFSSWPRVHVPKIYWEHSSARVLTMEFIDGLKVTDLDGMKAAGISPRTVNELMVQTYFKQLLEDGFFHADPHPGNLRVMRDGRLAFFDFGMVGHISPKLQSQMVSAFFHLLDHDINGIVEDLISLEFLSPDADIVSFRKVVADIFTRKLNLKLREVKFKELTYDLAPIVYEYPITTPARFTYLMRALMTLEGVSFVMNPDFNFFDVARPYARSFLLRKESALLRQQVMESLRDVRSGRLQFSRIWNLAKAAFALYFQRA